MTHQLYGKKWIKPKKLRGLIVVTDAGPNRRERRAAYANKGRMNSRGDFRFGALTSNGTFGRLLVDRYYAGKHIAAAFLGKWCGFKKDPKTGAKMANTDEFRAYLVSLRFDHYRQFDVRAFRKVS